jgi:hypothetical protein
VLSGGDVRALRQLTVWTPPALAGSFLSTIYTADWSAA